MMNAITLIPTAMAYAFIGLLFTILGFIMIYVCHKLYLTIYDSIPPHSVERMRIPKEEKEIEDLRERIMNEAESLTENPVKRSSFRLIKRESDQFGVKSQKTALRIVCNMERCYLAYVSFQTESPINQKKIIRFYDRLANIPIGHIMQPCSPDKRQQLKDALRRLSTVHSDQQILRKLSRTNSRKSNNSSKREEEQDKE